MMTRSRSEDRFIPLAGWDGPDGGCQVRLMTAVGPRLPEEGSALALRPGRLYNCGIGFEAVFMNAPLASSGPRSLNQCGPPKAEFPSIRWA